MSKNDKPEGIFIGNRPCICGTSSDGMSIYQKEDDDGNVFMDAYCRSGFCDRTNKYISKNELEEIGIEEVRVSEQKSFDKSVLDGLVYAGWRERGVTKSVSEKYGVLSELGNDGEPIARFYPSYKDGQMVGVKKRIFPKDFFSIGSVRATNELFGQNVFESNQKYLVITTGECFPEQCEVMTPKGWMTIKDVVENRESVIAVDQNRRAIEEEPLAYIKKEYNDDLVEISTARYYSLTTKNHKMLGFIQGEPRDFTADTIYQHADVPTSAMLDVEGIDLTKDQLALIIAVAADFKIDLRKSGNYYCHGQFKKQRKIDRITGLLNRMGIEYTTFDKRHLSGYVSFNFTAPEYLRESIDTHGKNIPSDWPTLLNQEQRLYVLDEISLWNGHASKKYDAFEFTAKHKGEVDTIQRMCALSGVHSKVGHKSNRFGDWWRVCYYPRKKNVSLQKYKKKYVPHKGYVYCVQTRSGYLLTRQNGFISVSGNCDAMSVAQALRQKKGDTTYWTPSVSVTCGDGSIIKQLKANHDYITSFEKVIIMFDQDESAQKYVDEACRLLKPGQAYVATLPAKDANELLREGRVDEIRQAFWKAEPFSRADVLHLSQMWDDFENEDSNTKIPFPSSWSTLNEMLNGGMEQGEITLVGALTSIGKSSIINNIVYHLLENTAFKVGAMYLETTRREVVRDLISLDAAMNFRRVDRSTVNFVELKNRFFNNLAKKDNFVYVDHQGSLSNDQIFEKLNYLAKAEDCKVIIIDPIQAAVNSSDNGAIIDFMDTLLKFAKETDTAIIAVSHMRKPDSDDPHNVTEYSLMGSSALNQIAFNTILLSRDKMNTDPVIRNATKVQLVKCRRTGLTGDAGWLRYDDKTTHLYATSDPYLRDIDEPYRDPELTYVNGEEGDGETF